MSAAAQNTTQPLGAQNGNAPIQAKPPSFLQKKGLLGGGMHGKGPISSPTDNVMSPCSAKLSGAKQRHFTKAKPVGIASQLSQLAAQHQASPAAKSGDKPKIDF